MSKKGVETRVVDLATASPPELKAVLEGVNYIVSAMSAEVLETQLPLFEAAKGAGVRRIIPSDFGTSAPPGAFALNDRVRTICAYTCPPEFINGCLQKLEIRDRVRQLGIPYTFVEIGWWMQLSLPYPPSLEDNQIAPLLNVIYNGGSKKNALTDVRRIGDLVALILQDERTLNQTVFFHEVEASAQEVWDVALQVSGLGESLLSRQVHVSC